VPARPTGTSLEGAAAFPGTTPGAPAHGVAGRPPGGGWSVPAGPPQTDAKAPRDDEPRGPLRRHAAWGWGWGLVGLGVGFGPQVLMYAVALGGAAPDSSAVKVTTGSATTLVVVSLVIYGWQTAAAWFCSVRVAGGRFSAWGFRLPTRAYFWTIPAALAVVYAASIAHDMIVHPRQQDIVGEFPHTAAGIALFVLLAVVIAPLFEEVFFRGFLFRAFASSWGWPAGAVVSSAVFGMAHAQLDVFLPLFVLGLMLAWVYKRTGSLWTSISLHALFNGISVMVWALGA